MRKKYESPEFDYIRLIFEAAICVSNNENPGLDNDEEFDDDDV